MKHIRSVVALALLAVFLAGIARATTSTVNPAVPCQNCPLSSSTIRNGISLPAYNDITNLWSAVATGSGISSISGDISCTGSPAAACALANTSTARADLGLPLGTSGATVGLLNGNLTFSGTDKFSLNATALPATQTGTVLQLGNADGVITRLEVDAFGNTPHFSAIRWDGTNAAPTAVQSGDGLGSLNFWGYNGTGVVGPQAAVRCFASQNWSVGSNGTYCDLDVTPNGSTTLTAAMTIGNDGGITVGTPTGGDKGAGTLNATGLYVNGTAVTGGGSGSGTVNTGTTPDIGYYATSSTALSDASGLQYNSTTHGLNLNGVNAHSLPDNGLDTTGVSIGASALLAQTTTGNNNVAVGNNAMLSLVTGTNDVAVGSGAGTATSSTSQAVAFGVSAKAGSGDVAIGYQALKNEPADNLSNVAIGYQAMGVGVLTSGNGANVAIGNAAMKALTSGYNNVAIGTNAGAAMTSAFDNMAIGLDALQFTTGNANTAIGDAAGSSLTSGSNNTIIGALVSAAGYAANLTTGSGNILIGTDGTTGAALSSTTSATAIGTGVIAGSKDTALGYQALHATITNNDSNTAIGFQALSSNTTGTNNTALGYGAGYAGTAITTGSSNTFLGYQAQANSATATNRTALGNGAISTADNDVVLGNSSVATIHAAVTSITAISDRRLKSDIQPVDLGLNFLMRLKPVSYRLKGSPQIKHLGFIAQDTEAALPRSYRAIVRAKDSNDRMALIEIENDKDGIYNMNYGELLAPMIKALQEQQVEIESLRKQLSHSGKP